MEEELFTPTEPTEEVTEEVAEETAPETPVWQLAGFESEDELKEAQNLKVLRQKAMAESRAAAEAKRSAAVPEKEPDPTDPWANVETIEDIKKAVKFEAAQEAQRAAASSQAIAEATFNREAENSFQDLSKKHDVDPDRVREVFNAYGLTIDPNDFFNDMANKVEAAAIIIKASEKTEPVNIDEKVAEETAARAVKGEKIVAVKPGKQTVSEPDTDVDDNKSVWDVLMGG